MNDLTEDEKNQMVQALLDKISPVCKNVNLGIVTHASMCLLASSICQYPNNEKQNALNHILHELQKMVVFMEKEFNDQMNAKRLV